MSGHPYERLEERALVAWIASEPKADRTANGNPITTLTLDLHPRFGGGRIRAAAFGRTAQAMIGLHVGQRIVALCHRERATWLAADGTDRTSYRLVLEHAGLDIWNDHEESRP